MKIPVRIALPVIGGLAFVAVLLLALFVQLEGTRVAVLSSLQETADTGMQAVSRLWQEQPAETGTLTDESLLQMRQADLHALRGEWKEARALYEQAASGNGGISAFQKKAHAELQLRDTRAARQTLDALDRRGARKEDLLLLEATILMYEAEMAKARTLLSSADDSPQKHYGLGVLGILEKNHEEAQAELQLAVAGWDPLLRSAARTILAAYEEYALFPESPETHLDTLLSRALAQVQLCELALPILSSVTATQSDYRDAWVVQGFCELSTDRTIQALSSLEQAYRLDPEKPQIQYFLARAYSQKGDHGNAITFLRYALKNGFEPETEVRSLLAKEALEHGDTTLALEQYEALTQADAATEELYEAYIEAALSAGKTEEARVKLEEALQRWPDSIRFKALEEELATE